MMNFFRKITVILLVPIFALLLGSTDVGAATEASIRVSSPATIREGSYFNAQIFINAIGSPIDTARVSIEFPKDILKADHVSQGVLFTSQSPSNNINNEKGVVTWGGFKIGGVDKRGVFATITFKALKTGRADIKIGGSTLLINGGEKVNYQTMNTSTTVQKYQKKNPEEASSLVVNSATHPSQEEWYQNDSPLFTWKAEGNSAFLIGISQDPSELPREKATTTEKTYQALSEGVWYFTVKLQDSDESNQYVVRIDKTAPLAITPIIDIQGVQDGSSILKVQFNTIDNASGIEKYEIRLDDEGFQVGASPVTLRDSTPELSRITVRAYDMAGNTTENTSTIEPDLKTLTTISSEKNNLESGSNVFSLKNIMTGLIVIGIMVLTGFYLWKKSLQK